MGIPLPATNTTSRAGPSVCLLSIQVTGKDGKPNVEVTVGNSEKRKFSPEELSAMLLTKMKETAEVRSL